jgi:hypothetical protein
LECPEYVGYPGVYERWLGGLKMQDRAKALAVWVAIVTIALQAVFGGLAGGPAIAAALDPMTIICHGDGSAPDGSTGRHAPATQHDCCTDCILCSSLSAAMPPNRLVAFAPSPLQTAAFIPFSAVEPTPLGGLAIHFARGPPRSA